MQGLMHLCRNWGSSECQSNVSTIMYPIESYEGEGTALWPDRQEQQRLDQICRSCPKRIFLAEEIDCLTCETGILQPAPLSQIKYTSGTEYLYECPECRTSYYAYSELG